MPAQFIANRTPDNAISRACRAGPNSIRSARFLHLAGDGYSAREAAPRNSWKSFYARFVVPQIHSQVGDDAQGSVVDQPVDDGYWRNIGALKRGLIEFWIAERNAFAESVVKDMRTRN